MTCIALDRGSVRPPHFGADFRAAFEHLVVWRRDVRRFRTDPVDPVLIDWLIALASKAPSVGNSQPWRFVSVESETARSAVRMNFVARNSEALAEYHGERARLYARLKLSGLNEAPVHVAVFCDEDTRTGHGLGRATMPETLRYSVVTAVHTIWLAARIVGLGVGWVSILDPEQLGVDLAVPESWRLVAYLCVGYPEEEHSVPELARFGWQNVDPTARRVHVR